jgi:hypothetical protein
VERVTIPRQAETLTLDNATITAKTYTIEGTPFIRPEHESLAPAAKKRRLGVVGLRLRRR